MDLAARLEELPGCREGALFVFAPQVVEEEAREDPVEGLWFQGRRASKAEHEVQVDPCGGRLFRREPENLGIGVQGRLR